MNSQVVYIQFSLLLTSAMVAVIFFIAWHTMGRKPYALTWSVGFAASAAYWLCILFKDAFPTGESYWLTANAFGLVLVTLWAKGHCQRTDCRFLPRHLWPYAVLVYAGIVWAAVIRPHAGVSVSLLPFASALTLVLSAVIVLRHRSRPMPAEWAAASLMFLFAAAQGLTASNLLSLGSDREAVFAQLYANPSFMAMPAGFVGIAMFVVFMLASDMSEEMKEIAIRDQLTGLLNRRGFREHATAVYAACRRLARPVSVIMTDIDHFKSVNDDFGHAAGDAALAHFAALLSRHRRAEDVVARMGGEEFAVVLPGTDLVAGIAIAEALCADLERSPFVVDGRRIEMTASFGVACDSSRDESLADIIVRADRALYRSKRSGRNRVDLESSQIMRAPDGSLQSIAS